MKKTLIVLVLFALWVFLWIAMVGCVSHKEYARVAFTTNNTYDLESKKFNNSPQEVVVFESIVNITDKSTNETLSFAATEILHINSNGRILGSLINYESGQRYYIDVDMYRREANIAKIFLDEHGSVERTVRYLWFYNIKEIPIQIK